MHAHLYLTVAGSVVCTWSCTFYWHERQFACQKKRLGLGGNSNDFVDVAITPDAQQQKETVCGEREECGKVCISLLSVRYPSEVAPCSRGERRRRANLQNLRLPTLQVGNESSPSGLVSSPFLRSSYCDLHCSALHCTSASNHLYSTFTLLFDFSPLLQCTPVICLDSDSLNRSWA